MARTLFPVHRRRGQSNSSTSVDATLERPATEALAAFPADAPSDSGPQIFVGMEVDVDFDELDEDTDSGMLMTSERLPSQYRPLERLTPQRPRLDTWERLGADLGGTVVLTDG